MPTNECLCYWWAAYWLPKPQLLHLLLTVSVPQQLERMTFSTTVKMKSLFLLSSNTHDTTMNIRFLSFFINTFATNISRLLDKALQQGRLRKLQISHVPSLPSTQARQIQLSHFRLYNTNKYFHWCQKPECQKFDRKGPCLCLYSQSQTTTLSSALEKWVQGQRPMAQNHSPGNWRGQDVHEDTTETWRQKWVVIGKDET